MHTPSESVRNSANASGVSARLRATSKRFLRGDLARFEETFTAATFTFSHRIYSTTPLLLAIRGTTTRVLKVNGKADPASAPSCMHASYSTWFYHHCMVVCHQDRVSHVAMPHEVVPKPRHCRASRDFKSTLYFEVSRGENRPTNDHEARPERTKASEDVLPPTCAPQVSFHRFFRPRKAQFGDLQRPKLMSGTLYPRSFIMR